MEGSGGLLEGQHSIEGRLKRQFGSGFVRLLPVKAGA